MWKFNQDNCNKAKIFKGQPNSNLNTSIVEKKTFEKELTLNSLRKRQHTTNNAVNEEEERT